MLKLLYILIAIVILGFIVTMHEFGHYIIGRLCGIGIVEFSVGFGPKIIGFERKGIKYSVRCIPLGGYCSFVGEDQENPTPNAMNNQPVWKRLLTVFAGPAMNFILAFVFCVVFLCGFITAEYLPKVNSVVENMPAAECGIQAGDIITSVNETDVTYNQSGINTLSEIIRGTKADEPIQVTVQRGNETIDLTVTPDLVTDETTGESVKQIGITFGGRRYTFTEALGSSCGYMVSFTKEMVRSLKQLVFHGEGVNDMMGPVGIVSFVSDYVYDEHLYAVVYLIFVLSLNIGIMNLLPLPALDGGRIIILLIEGIRRKPIPAEKEGLIHMIGFSLLLVLVLIITYRDILRLLIGS